MKYYGIIKMELAGDNIIQSPVGFVTNKEEAEALIGDGLTPYVNWYNDNKEALDAGEITYASYLDTNPACCQIGWVTTDIGNTELPQIKQE